MATAPRPRFPVSLRPPASAPLYYIDQMEKQRDGEYMALLSEFVPTKWWHHLLHNQTVLPFYRGKVVVSIP
jgi:hypothetical protein